MVFQRYASPMVILDKMILTKRFTEFVSEFIEIKNKELIDQARWDFWLHKVFDMSFDEYLSKVDSKTETNEVLPDDVLEATVKDSMGIINGFCLS